MRKKDERWYKLLQALTEVWVGEDIEDGRYSNVIGGEPHEKEEGVAK